MDASTLKCLKKWVGKARRVLEGAPVPDMEAMRVTPLSDWDPGQHAFCQQPGQAESAAAQSAAQAFEQLAEKGLLLFATAPLGMEPKDQETWGQPTLSNLWERVQGVVSHLGALGEPVHPHLSGAGKWVTRSVYQQFATCVPITVDACSDMLAWVQQVEELLSSSGSTQLQLVMGLSLAAAGLQACQTQAYLAAEWPVWADPGSNAGLVPLAGGMPSYQMAVSHLQLAGASLHVRFREALKWVTLALEAVLCTPPGTPISKGTVAWGKSSRQTRAVARSLLAVEPEQWQLLRRRFKVGYQATALAAAALEEETWELHDMRSFMEGDWVGFSPEEVLELQRQVGFHHWSARLRPAVDAASEALTAEAVCGYPFSELPAHLELPSQPAPNAPVTVLLARELLVAVAEGAKELEWLWVGWLPSSLRPYELHDLLAAAAPSPEASAKWQAWEYDHQQQQHRLPAGQLEVCARTGAYAAQQQRQLLVACDTAGNLQAADALLVAATLLTVQVLKALRLLGSQHAGPLMLSMQQVLRQVGMPHTARWQRLLGRATRPVHAPAWGAGYVGHRELLDPEGVTPNVHMTAAAAADSAAAEAEDEVAVATATLERHMDRRAQQQAQVNVLQASLGRLCQQHQAQAGDRAYALPLSKILLYRDMAASGWRLMGGRGPRYLAVTGLPLRFQDSANRQPPVALPARLHGRVDLGGGQQMVAASPVSSQQREQANVAQEKQRRQARAQRVAAAFEAVKAGSSAALPAPLPDWPPGFESLLLACRQRAAQAAAEEQRSAAAQASESGDSASSDQRPPPRSVWSRLGDAGHQQAPREQQLKVTNRLQGRLGTKGAEPQPMVVDAGAGGESDVRPERDQRPRHMPKSERKLKKRHRAEGEQGSHGGGRGH